MIGYKIFKASKELMKKDNYDGNLIDYLYNKINRFFNRGGRKIISIQFDDHFIKGLNEMVKEKTYYVSEYNCLVTYEEVE